MFYPERIFTSAQEEEIVAAIRTFERRTSGEMRVHVEHRLRRPPVDEAIRVFEALRMQQTQARNGVLILLAPEQKSFSVFGDIGINEVTSDTFWEETCTAMQPFFAKGEYVQGLIKGIAIAGEALAEHFPWQEGDINELPDEISYG
ncbi:MAG: TPM domain-containing protein [Saprospiraceae bacterium]